MKKIIILFITILFLNQIGNSQVRLTVVDPIADVVTLHNYGLTTVDVSTYWFCALFSYNQLNGLTVISGSTNLVPGADVTLSGYALNNASSDLGLYNSPSFSSPAAMEDFTQWGAGGQGRETVAVAKGIWTVGTFISGLGIYGYTGNGTTDNGVAFWNILPPCPNTGVSPVAVCQNFTVVLDASGNGTLTANNIDGGSTDDCGITSMTASQTTFSCTDIGVGGAVNDLVITAAYDGPLTGGTPKGVELYVINNIADLSLYGVGFANNGGGTDGEEFTFPAVAVTAGTFIYVASDSAQFNNWFGFNSDYVSGNAGINGDDAIELFFNNNVIDVFGDIAVDGTNQPWEYLDGWAYRNNGTGPDGTTFVLGSWSFSGKNALDGETTNASATTPVPIGTYTPPSAGISVTLTVTDGEGNTNNCIATVTVVDTLAPTITCPGNQTENPNASCQFTLPDYTGLATAADNCNPAPTVTQSPIAGTVISGTTTITLTTNDGNGNTSTCQFDVILNDVTVPTAVCQNINVFLDGTGNVTIIAADIDGGSTDNCAGLTVSASHALFTCADLGPNNVTLTAIDGNGNSNNCIAVVTVIDTISPTISCPGNQTETPNASCQFTLPDYTGLAIAADNCSASPTVTQLPTAGTVILGTTTITFTADDGNGNTSICTFDVNLNLSACAGIECVSAIVLAPMILCGDTQNVTGSTIGGTPQAVGTCGTSAGTGGANWYTFTGDGGNWTVSTVSGATNYDTKLWIFEGTCGSLNCIAGNDDFSGVQSQVTFPTTAGLTYYAVVGGFAANEGNYDMTIFNEDAGAPVPDVTTLADVTAECAVTSLTAPTATDNCGTVTVTNNATLPINTQGATLVTWTYDDGNGNTSTQTQNIVITDVTAPVITCPGNQTETPNVSCQFTLPDYTGLATAADNCNPAPVVAQSPASGTVISGTTTITLTADDGNGNTSTCTFDVILTDATAPTAVCQNINVFLDGTGNATIIAADIDGGSTDNCAGLTFSASQTAFTCADLGPNNITLTVTDGNSNSSNCVAIVTVLDTLNPIITCPANINACEGDVINFAASVADNCVVTTISQTDATGFSSGMIFPVGTTTIEFTVTDLAGNTAVCTFDVIVTSVNTSVTTNGNDTLISNAAGATYQWLDCNNGNAIITGATNQTFIASASGDYAVEVTLNGCVDTSACINVLITGINETNLTNSWILYPNPTIGDVTLSLGSLINNAKISIIDVTGKEVYFINNVNTNQLSINTQKFSKGIYFVKIQSESQQKVIKLIRQ